MRPWESKGFIGLKHLRRRTSCLTIMFISTRKLQALGRRAVPPHTGDVVVILASRSESLIESEGLST